MRVLARLTATNPLPTAFCHGASLLPRPDGTLLAAWFGGTEEGQPDSGIYCARLAPGAEAWEPPQVVAPADGHPCGNPVLFSGAGEDVWLAYFRVWGAWCTGGKPCARISRDGGRTWGPEMVLLDRAGVLTKNKPLRLGDELLLPVYDELRWQVGIARLDLAGLAPAWRFDDLAIGAGSGVAMIQGTLAETSPGRLLMLMRTKTGRIWQVESRDGGITWGRPEPTALRNPNAGIDMVRLPDGRLWLCYNDTDQGRDPMRWDLRYPLCLAESEDAGASWRTILTLEAGPGEYSYPAIVSDTRGIVHVAYTVLRRGIRHVVIAPA
ncbi:MAG: sialidase family protein [Armatimonadota bacterium]|nr:sialidase family protein [Armatimonadota bacterium]